MSIEERERVVIKPEDWLNLATEFNFGKCKFYGREVKIVAARQIDDSTLWKVLMDGWVLGKDKEWYWEPNPSSRTDRYLRNTRYKSKEDAYDFWKKNVTSEKPLFIN